MTVGAGTDSASRACRLDATEQFSLAPSDREGTSVLFDEGIPTKTTVDGDQLEAQFATLRSQHLIILSEGSPYESGLYIYLLDEAHEPIDAIELAAPYVSGLFVAVETPDNRETQFQFDGDTRYVLRVLDSPRWWLPLPRGARRHGGWKTRRTLDLRRITNETPAR